MIEALIGKCMCEKPCPMTANSNPILKELHAKFGGAIEFVTLCVRKAHPGEHHDQTSVAERKREVARALKSRDQLPWTDAVDDPNGSIVGCVRSRPLRIWLIGRGPSSSARYGPGTSGVERRHGRATA